MKWHTEKTILSSYISMYGRCQKFQIVGLDNHIGWISLFSSPETFCVIVLDSDKICFMIFEYSKSWYVCSQNICSLVFNSSGFIKKWLPEKFQTKPTCSFQTKNKFILRAVDETSQHLNCTWKLSHALSDGFTS